MCWEVLVFTKWSSRISALWTAACYESWFSPLLEAWTKTSLVHRGFIESTLCYAQTAVQQVSVVCGTEAILLFIELWYATASWLAERKYTYPESSQRKKRKLSCSVTTADLLSFCVSICLFWNVDSAKQKFTARILPHGIMISNACSCPHCSFYW